VPHHSISGVGHVKHPCQPSQYMLSNALTGLSIASNCLDIAHVHGRNTTHVSTSVHGVKFYFLSYVCCCYFAVLGHALNCGIGLRDRPHFGSLEGFDYNGIPF